VRVYGSEASYYTGKLEGYLRYKEIPYERAPLNVAVQREARRRLGVMQFPVAVLPDGRWMTDTTPMIEWLESQHPQPAVIPPDPVQAFASRLLEDYADEWLWRPAMHYRWSYPEGAYLRSRQLASELTQDLPLPEFVKRFLIRRRQFGRFVRGDGVTAETRAHVEDTYLRTLDQLEAVLAVRPFLLGAAPTLADFGFFGSMFRHFGIDPNPAVIMRERAPGVYAWLARLWNARGSRARLEFAPGVPTEWGPLLREVGAVYLPYLAANAEAWKRGRRALDFETEGVSYRLPTSRYRVWCLERLRAAFEAAPPEARPEIRALLEQHGGWEPLFRTEGVRSGYDEAREAPFGSANIPVFGG
jgi:glutathione S-transferase